MITVNFHLASIVVFWNGELNSINNILKIENIIKNIKIYQMKNKKYPMIIASYQLIYN